MRASFIWSEKVCFSEPRGSPVAHSPQIQFRVDHLGNSESDVISRQYGAMHVASTVIMQSNSASSIRRS